MVLQLNRRIDVKQPVHLWLERVSREPERTSPHPHGLTSRTPEILNNVRRGGASLTSQGKQKPNQSEAEQYTGSYDSDGVSQRMGLF